MPRPRAAPDLHLLSKVSALYHLRDETQQAIAERLGISRPTVSRLLQEAKDLGIVRVTVSAPEGLHLELEHQLEERFQLVEAYVVPAEAGQPGELIRAQLGAAAAAYLVRAVQSEQTIGLAWGTTLSAMIQAVPTLPTRDVHIVQTLGGIGPPDAEAYVAGLVRRLAQLLGATAVLLPAPGVVATPTVRNGLRNDPHVKAALRHFDRLDMVFAGIGSLQSNPMLHDGSFPASVRRELRVAGAVGDIALRFFNAAGAPVRTSLDDRILGITTEQLHKVPRVVAVAGGAGKIDAIRAALMSKMINVLITDQRTAEVLGMPAGKTRPTAAGRRGR